MRFLKISFSLFLLSLILSACQSNPAFQLQTFPANEATGDLHIIQVKADRVRQKCLFMNAEAENKWRHQYFMYVLNDRNEVIEIMQSTHQSKEGCESQSRKIEKILRFEPRVKICVREKFDAEPAFKNDWVQFDSLGRHKITYGSPTLDSICNSKNCFSNNEVWTNTCPGFAKY